MARFHGHLLNTCIPPWSITTGYKDTSYPLPSPPLPHLLLKALTQFLGLRREGRSSHLGMCSLFWCRCSGTLSPCCSALEFQSVFFSSHSLILLPEDTTARKPFQSHPSLEPAAPAVPAPKQTLHVSPQSALCPVPWEGEKTLAVLQWHRSPPQACVLGSLSATSAANKPTLQLGIIPPGTLARGNSESWKATQFLLHPEKQLNYPTQDMVSVFSVPWWAQYQWEWWICHPGIPVSSLGTMTGDFLQTGHQAANVTGGRALPGRNGIDCPSLFLPGTISLLQFILFNSQPPEGFGGSEGNDTRDYKSITITEPFIW